MAAGYYTKADDLEHAYTAPEIVRQRMHTLKTLGLNAGKRWSMSAADPVS